MLIMPEIKFISGIMTISFLFLLDVESVQLKELEQSSPTVCYSKNLAQVKVYYLVLGESELFERLNCLPGIACIITLLLSVGLVCPLIIL